MDLQDVLGFTMSPFELILRATLVYWFLFLVFRFIMRRDVGAIGTADVLLLVLVADASQNAMTGAYSTVPEGVLVMSTLLAWNWILNWASFHWEVVAKLTDPPPLMLIRHGKLLMRNLRREHLTPDELKSMLRERGIASFSEVRAAFLESGGAVSVLRRSPQHWRLNGGSGERHPTDPDSDAAQQDDAQSSIARSGPPV